jgi:predicted lysophospholipase L1 biosynthesis ABC-type transport system permease subunit
MPDEVLERGNDPKGWDRASIQINTHPLHRFPNVSPLDLLRPTAANKVRLVLDCLAVGVSLALLVYFPLLMIAFTTTIDLTAWILGTMVTIGGVAAVLLFFAALADEREFRSWLES